MVIKLALRMLKSPIHSKMKLLSKNILRSTAIVLLFTLCLQTLRTACANYVVPFSLLDEVICGSIHGLNILCLIVVGMLFYCHHNHMPSLDKPFYIVSHITAWSWLLTLIIGVISIKWQQSDLLMHIPNWLLIIDAVLLVVWLWMMSNRIGQDVLPKPLSSIALFGAIIGIILIVLMLISTIYVICTGYLPLNGLGTNLYYHWIRLVVPAVWLSGYAMSISLKHFPKHIYSIMAWAILIGVVVILLWYQIEKDPTFHLLCPEDYTPILYYW